MQKILNPTWDNAIKIFDWENYISNDFNNERDLCNFIELNKIEFAKEILEIDYKSHKREFYLGTGRRYIDKNMARVDFLFTSQTNQNIIIECKNPSNTYTELRNGLIQLMAYYCDCKIYGFKVDRMILVTTKFNPIIQLIIKEFKLNIEVIVFSKAQCMKLYMQN